MSKLTRCGQTIKGLFAVANVFILLLGLTAIGFGIFLPAINEDLDYVTDSHLFSGAALFVTAGVAIVIVAAFGIIAGWSEVWQLLAFYNFCASGLVIVTLAAAIFGVVAQDDIYQRAEEKFVTDISSYKQENDSDYNPEANQFVDDIQSWFHCCGLSGPGDWLKQNLDYCIENQGLPDSCNCTSDINDECTEVTIPKTNFVNYTFISWTKGCDDSIDSMTFSEVLYVGMAVIAIVFCEVSAMCCSCRLCYLLLRHNRRQCRNVVSYHPLENLNHETVSSSSAQDHSNKPSYPPLPAYNHHGTDYYPSSHPV